MPDRRWSVLVTRDGDVAARRFQVSARRLVGAAAAIGLTLAVVVFWLGLQAGHARADARVAELDARVDSLTEENAKVMRLAARLEEIESTYQRLRAVMGGEVATSARDILLPPVRSDRADRPVRPTEAGQPGLWPLVESGFVTRSFGDSVPGEGPHAGLDIAIPVGSYVRAAGAGVVEESGADAEYGRYVRIQHPDGMESLYAHNSWTFVAVGDSVEAGEVIALSGNTGRSTAPHLHLEIQRGGTRVDPLPFISDRL